VVDRPTSAPLHIAFVVIGGLVSIKVQSQATVIGLNKRVIKVNTNIKMQGFSLALL